MPEQPNQPQVTPGIRSALRKIAEKEGDKAALQQAYKWQAALEEIRAVACPKMYTARPGGPQKLCADVLLLAINDYIHENPLSPKPVADDACPDDKGEGV